MRRGAEPDRTNWHDGHGSTGTTTGAAAPTSGIATAPSGATIEPAAFNNATAVRDGLIKRGIDADTATAFAANALHESVANPATGRGDNGNSAGLFMWAGPRLQAYTDAYGHPPDGSPLDEQLDNVVRELKGSEAPAAAQIAQAQGPAAKAAAVSQYYLRPKDTVPEMQRRSATALQLQQQIGGGATTATAAPTTAQPGQPVPTQVASNTPMVSSAPAAPTAAPGGPPAAPQFTYPNGKVGGAPDAQGGVQYGDGSYGTPPPGPRVPVAAAAPVLTPAQPGQPQGAPAAPAAAPASTSRLPDASTIPTGRNSAAWQQAQQLIDRGNQMLIVAGSNAGMRASAERMIQQGTQQQQLDHMVPAQQDGRPGNLNTTTGQFTPFAPLPSPRGMQGSAAVWNPKSGWEPPTNDNANLGPPVQGTWTVTGSGQQFLPAATTPAEGGYDVQKGLLKEDNEKLPEYSAQNQIAAANQIRIQQMRELVNQISSGAGERWRADLGQHR